jgi:hypothetical protein
LILLCLVCAAPCWAADPLAGLLACRAMTDAAARLACFDRETAALASAPAAPVAVAPATTAPVAAAPVAASPITSPAAPSPALPTAPPLTPEQKFGLSSSSIAAKEAAGTQAPKETKLQARITGLTLAGDGRTLFTLDNSQVWRQLEADGTDVMARLGDPVTISRGLLGSYWLALKTGRGCKVSRLR